jgi:hypothetical protein
MDIALQHMPAVRVRSAWQSSGSDRRFQPMRLRLAIIVSLVGTILPGVPVAAVIPIGWPSAVEVPRPPAPPPRMAAAATVAETTPAPEPDAWVLLLASIGGVWLAMCGHRRPPVVAS